MAAASVSAAAEPRPIVVPSLLGAVRGRGAVLVARTGEAAQGATRGLSAAAIAAGIALFAVASVATPLVTDQVGAQKSPPFAAAAEPSIAPNSPVASASTAVTAPAKPGQPAPADPVTISALAGNGIPLVALNAYRVAAARVDHADPGCHLDWSLLAGIGRVESDHGRYDGASLNTDGTSSPPIVGPALTGARWQYFPADPRYVAVTGDSTYAHPLGPMQFIPSTWSSYGVDGDGDGKVDVFDVNDAALAAARYLCIAGGDLGTRAGQALAVYAYNHNSQYLAQVLALADAYKRGVPVTGIPVGNITGALPKITHHGALPPANPGAPTAVEGSTHNGSAPKPKPTSSSGSSSGSSPSGSSPSGASSSGSSSAPTSGNESTPPQGDSGGPSSTDPVDSSGGSDTATDDPTDTPTDSDSPTTTLPDPSDSASSTDDPSCSLLVVTVC